MLGEGSESAIKSALCTQLQQSQVRLERDAATAHFARLDQTVGYLEWHNSAARIVLAAGRLAKVSRGCSVYGSDNSSRRHKWAAELPEAGRWSEFSIGVDALRLRGRIDSLEITDGHTVVVRDFKTGPLRKPDGQIRDDIALQLRIYGLLVRELAPKSDIRLCVSNCQDESDVPFDDGDEIKTRSTIQELLAALAAGTTRECESLARPGPTCRHCPYGAA